MSARKVPLFKKFLEPAAPAPAVFPIPEGEIVKISYALEHPPVHPKANVFGLQDKSTLHAALRNPIVGGSN